MSPSSQKTLVGKDVGSSVASILSKDEYSVSGKQIARSIMIMR